MATHLSRDTAENQMAKFMEREELNELEEQGLIQSFEYNHELAWKTQKDLLESQGYQNLLGSRDVARKAFEAGLIPDGDIWLKMIKSRNLTSHTYNEDTAKAIMDAIIDDYYAAFQALHAKLSEPAKNEMT
ncbi:MAG: nucleotidyltransferase [Gammaproteobacteria bacterium]|nr:nucleotidyltransferase [Gammaproteobacteria bacterium]